MKKVGTVVPKLFEGNNIFFHHFQNRLRFGLSFSKTNWKYQFSSISNEGVSHVKPLKSATLIVSADTVHTRTVVRNNKGNCFFPEIQFVFASNNLLHLII